LTGKLKLAIFTSETHFLEWTKSFDARFFTPVSGSGVRFVISKASMAMRMRLFLRNADAAFADFLTPIAAKVTHVSTKPVFIRIHRFELDYPDIFTKVNWDNVAGVIAVSEHYRGLIGKLIPKDIPLVAIPPGVDENQWPFHPCESGRICTWALPSARKRIYDLSLALKGYTLHVGGLSARDRILIDRNERWSLGHVLEPDAQFPSWLWDKEIYVHHALDESFGVAISEAMLSGLIPLVHRVPCVTEFVPESLTFIYDNELRSLIETIRLMASDERLALKESLRQTILDKYTARTTALRIADFISSHI